MEDWEAPYEGGADALGERVRTLRRSAGLSQAELAGGRFSKEYVSQIERGKTRPTRETLAWLAGRLETDTEYLEHGLSRADTERLEADTRNAELLLEAHRYEEALRGVPHRPRTQPPRACPRSGSASSPEKRGPS